MIEPANVIDVAAHAGVSVGTVSNVMNRPERVAPATRERVLRSISELGYVRNEAARQLRAGTSRTIGLVVLDIGNPFFTDLAAGAEIAAAKQGLTLILCNSNDDVQRESHYLSLLQEQRAFGILITPVTRNTAAIQQLRRRGTPVVLVDRNAGRRQCSVSVNDRLGGELAVDHLVAQGHERIAFVGGPLTLNQVAERLSGARAAWEAAGRLPAALTVLETPALNVACGRTAGEQLLEAPASGRPTAVFCANDLLALGVLQEMTRSRLRIPGEIAILGYDDIDFAAAAAVPLTSVRQPRSQLGQAAMDLLIEEGTAAEHQHRQVVFEPELVVRESTSPA